jgi:hypothetical protein
VYVLHDERRLQENTFYREFWKIEISIAHMLQEYMVYPIKYSFNIVKLLEMILRKMSMANNSQTANNHLFVAPDFKLDLDGVRVVFCAR